MGTGHVKPEEASYLEVQTLPELAGGSRKHSQVRHSNSLSSFLMRIS